MAKKGGTTWDKMGARNRGVQANLPGLNPGQRGSTRRTSATLKARAVAHAKHVRRVIAPTKKGATP